MLKTCLCGLQIIKYFYKIHLLGYIYMYFKNISETKSSTFMETISLRDQKKMWYDKTRVTSFWVTYYYNPGQNTWNKME